ncbi:MAG: hypothetical protein H6R08_103 [Proteobacteria bacterium]|jgi:tetratricopeptide (TPR) repeat protein|nr:hypothetical protein [Pseudomonadota bacterium]
MRFFGWVNFMLLASIALPAAAASNWSEAEIKALPPLCQERLTRVPGQVGYWKNILGPDFVHTHHYCNGLGHINRYYHARTPQQKTYSLQNAYGALDYMVRNASPTYSLMPDIYLNRGLVLSLQGDYGGALTDLRKARELNPKLVRAYTLGSDIHAKLKQKNEALNVVAEGLRHVPDSSVLQRIYKERGGKLPYPEPIATALGGSAPPESASPKAEAVAGEGKASDTPSAAIPEPNTAAGGANVSTPAAPNPTAPKIGSPTNPWCRFCPDPAQ